MVNIARGYGMRAYELAENKGGINIATHPLILLVFAPLSKGLSGQLYIHMQRWVYKYKACQIKITKIFLSFKNNFKKVVITETYLTTRIIKISTCFVYTGCFLLFDNCD